MSQYFLFFPFQMDVKTLPTEIQRIHKIYTDPTSPIFLDKNNERLLKFIKKTDPRLQYLTKTDILAYKDRLTQISKDKERRILRGRKRYLSHRKFKVYGPLNIRK